ncbi:ABC transporter permease [Rugosimonospora acidiphila]|uniref:ABC transporter permease n=1 Tax=Rugosimonospora acidiphila TaxID=556531 RepID=A0ABP9RJW5_9ACTN
MREPGRATVDGTSGFTGTPASGGTGPGWAPDDHDVAGHRGGDGGRPRGLVGNAWRDLRHSPIFWVAGTLVVLFLLMAAAPRIFTSLSPTACQLSRSQNPPSARHWFGTDLQGCDVYARTIYGARASILVGVLSTLVTGVLALTVGMAAGYFGGWIDALLTRIVDIVLGIPLLLAAIVLSRSFGARELGVWPIVVVLGSLGWTTGARVVRSCVIAAKRQDYVQSARMLGAGHWRIMLRHILPNTIAPFIVVLTIALGVFIATEATLSFLGVGLRPPIISWGDDISTAQGRFYQAPWPLLFPSGFLALTVVAFSMLGEALREAFDPRLR